MCAVSMIADDWTRKRLPEYPWIYPEIPSPIPPITIPKRKRKAKFVPKAPSQEEFDRLKREVEKLREELIKAKQQDVDEGNEDCEMEEKIEVLKRVGKIVGIALEEILRGSKTSRRK